MRLNRLTQWSVKPVLVLSAVMLMGAFTATASAQQQDGQGQGQNGQGGNGQNGQGVRGNRGNRFNPEEMRKMMEDRMKEAMGVSDDEWTALQPRIEAVVKLQQQLAPNRAMLFRRGGQNGQGNNADGNNNNNNRRGGMFGEQTGPVADATKELQATLDKSDASADDIKAKLAALRDARTKVKGDLTKAQEELKGLVTSRQEAVLLELGILD